MPQRLLAEATARERVASDEMVTEVPLRSAKAQRSCNACRGLNDSDSFQGQKRHTLSPIGIYAGHSLRVEGNCQPEGKKDTLTYPAIIIFGSSVGFQLYNDKSVSGIHRADATRHSSVRKGNMKSYVFRVIVEPDDDRWIAYSPVLEDKGGATWGYTEEEALENIRQVLQMTVESMLEHGEPIPEEPEKEVFVSSEPRVAVNL